MMMDIYGYALVSGLVVALMSSIVVALYPQAPGGSGVGSGMVLMIGVGLAALGYTVFLSSSKYSRAGLS